MKAILKTSFIVLSVMLCVSFLTGCSKEKEQKVELVIIGHDIKTILEDGKTLKEYYLQLEAPNENTFLVKIDYQEKLMYTFQSTYKIGTKIIVNEKDLVPFEKVE